MRRVRGVVAQTVVLLGAVVASACGSGVEQRTEIPQVYDLDHDPAADITSVSADRRDVLPAADLRLALEGLFVSHGITLVQAMQAAERGDGSAEAWIDELVSNTDDITGAVGLVYGPVGADAFHQQWAQHTQFLVDYADALRRGSSDDADTARGQLASYAADSGSLLSTALAGALSAEDAETVLTVHVDAMIDQIERYHEGEVVAAADVALADNAHLVGVAGVLSSAFAAQQPVAFPGAADDPLTLICSIAGRSGGDLALLALAGESDGERSNAAVNELLGVLDGADSGYDLSADQVAALVAEIDSAAASGDQVAAIEGVADLRAAIDAASPHTD
jgi:hypothetical protein